MTEEQQDGLAQTEAIASDADETTDRAAAAIAVADEPVTADPVATTAADDASPTADEAPEAADSATDGGEPVGAVADDAAAPDPVGTEAQAGDIAGEDQDTTSAPTEAIAESALSASPSCDAVAG